MARSAIGSSNFTNPQSLFNHLCGFRLSLEDGVPVSTSDQTAKTTVYAVPTAGDKISLYDGSAWRLYSSAQMSVAVPSTVFRLFDVFCYANAGTPTLETLDWATASGSITAATNAAPIVLTSTSHGLSTGDIVIVTGVGGNTAANGTWVVTNSGANSITLDNSRGNAAYTSGGTWYKVNTDRATALAWQDGRRVKNGDATRLYLGTGMTTETSGQCEDSLSNRLLWSYYNRVQRSIYREEGNSHTYNVAAYRYANNDGANHIKFVLGLLDEYPFLIGGAQIVGNTGNGAAVAGAILNVLGPGNTGSFGVNGLTAGTIRMAGAPFRSELYRTGFNFSWLGEISSSAVSITFAIVSVRGVFRG